MASFVDRVPFFQLGRYVHICTLPCALVSTSSGSFLSLVLHGCISHQAYNYVRKLTLTPLHSCSNQLLLLDDVQL